MTTHPSVRRLSILPALVAVVAACGVLACENTRKGLEKDSATNMDKAREGAKELKEDAKEGAKELQEDAKAGAEKAAEATAEVLDDAGKKAAAASRTVAVKTALMADKRVDASHVDVDSEADAKIVHLRGRVSSSVEKTIAEEIAREHADGWTVSNELAVSSQ